MSQRGVTLVELMIVILIIGLIAVAASPFTDRWVSSARISESVAAMEEAVGRAKAAAMRNTIRVTGDKGASRICFANATLKVVVPTAANQDPSCDSTPLWSAKLADKVTIKVPNSIDWSCSCFNNKGLLTKVGGCNVCSDTQSLDFYYSGVADEANPHKFY